MRKAPKITNNTFRDTFNCLRYFLSRGQKKKMLLLGFLMFTSAIMDVAGLASLLPLIKISTDPSFIHSNEYLSAIHSYSGATSDSQFIMFFVLAILAYFIFKSAFGLMVIYIQARFSTSIVMTITKFQYNKYYSMNFHQLSSINSSDIVHQVQNIPHNFIAWIFTPCLTFISESMIISLIIIGIASYNFVLFALIALAIAPASLSIYYGIRNKSQQLGKVIDTVRPFAHSSLVTSIMGYVDIVLINRAKFYSKKFFHYSQRYFDQNIKSTMISFIPMKGYEIVAILGVVVIFMYAHFFAKGSDEVLIFVGMFAAAAYRLMPSLNRIMTALMYMEVNQISISNLYKHIDEIDYTTQDIEQREVHFNNSLNIKDVSFQFPDSDTLILNKINIEIKKGETVGIVGPSGSGKTTLLNLILRFYEPVSGQLLSDGEALTQENIVSWRGKLGYVKQDIFLLDGSIAENISLGETEFDKERMEAAIKQASLWEFVNEQTDGWNTRIGEKGSKLSGGQRQRIGIARALYREAEILVFDEATSALDSKTEQEVSDSITQLSKTKKTIFIVAHRITTLKNCNRIYEIKDGVIEGVHTYDELIEKVM
ncbi:MAG: ABC transporter ATP-binding protein [Bacteroidia bacterium]|nr:ABC transporter ATP-binding protein/permease [Bacteroidia bacterium]NNC85791.1 ABC transporter ATP-binding protein [Bacteroidia bacterium]NNM15623.1 ABC transporter ATP-binding protein [Bacteroidia bacterium]